MALPTDRSKVDVNMPMRLDIAAKLAFPDGSIGPSALRTEARKGRLEMLRVANKDMVTLAGIDAMVALCKVVSAEPASKPNKPLRRTHEPSKEERGAAALAALLRAAEKPNTRQANGEEHAAAPAMRRGPGRPRKTA